MNKSFGHHFRRIRERAGKSPEQLGELAGVHPQIIRKLESGQSAWPRLDTAAKLAKALGLTTDDLYP